jgi:hypothetical protein
MTDQTEQREYRYAAATYLHIWLTFDRRVHDAFHATGPTEEALRTLLTRYFAMRTLRGVKEVGLAPFVAALRQSVAGQVNDVVALVRTVNDAISPTYKNRNCISAVSKALWMMRRHPVAIYDSLSRDGLRKFGEAFNDGDYAQFHAAWCNYFNRQHAPDHIASACDWLVHSAFATNLGIHAVATRSELEQWTREPWFRNRVCDFRLMQAGSAPGHEADLALYLGPDR